MPECEVHGCCNPAQARRWCKRHWQQWRRTGRPDGYTRHSPVEAREFMATTVLSYREMTCLHWPYSRSGHGYGRLTIDGVRQAAHVYVCTAVHGPKPSRRHIVLHSCNNGAAGCVNPVHLRWGTHVENSADQVMHGTAPIGVRHGLAKLDEDKVRQIWALRETETQQEIGRRFGVGASTIGSIFAGRNWAHVRPA